jgi:3-deoxy-manno-octulosonate cytidylyltransferase (CMP-KDO synthetase)
MTASNAAIILPARYHSTRFPGKPLAVIVGKPLIEWVYRRAEQVAGVSRIIVATDHDSIATAVRGFGGEVVMTAAEHRTGTDRVAEVARGLDCEYIVNLQGDEPVFPPELIGEMLAALDSSRDVDIATACHRIHDDDSMNNPNHVKVVLDGAGRALYFSRAPIPFTKFKRVRLDSDVPVFRHIGIYAFRRASLLRFADSPPSPLEEIEGLEQLRALEKGMTMQVVTTDYSTVGVDVPEDIKVVEKALASA